MHGTSGQVTFSPVSKLDETSHPVHIIALLQKVLYILGASKKTGISESQCFIFIFKVKYHPYKSFYTQNKPLSNVNKVILILINYWLGWLEHFWKD